MLRCECTALLAGRCKLPATCRPQPAFRDVQMIGWHFPCCIDQAGGRLQNTPKGDAECKAIASGMALLRWQVGWCIQNLVVTKGSRAHVMGRNTLLQGRSRQHTLALHWQADSGRSSIFLNLDEGG